MIPREGRDDSRAFGGGQDKGLRFATRRNGSRVRQSTYNPRMDLDAALAQLASDRSAPGDGAERALHLARDEYPDLDVPAYLARLAELACQAAPHLAGDLERRVAGLSQFLFDE